METDFIQFLGIGAQKTGTTWLYAMLKPHPQLFLPEIKELHFWDANEAMGLNWYLSNFAKAHPGQKKGEITPAYAILPPAKIQQIHALLPSARLIYMMRDPAARAWSGALMALARAEMQFGEASDQWFIDHFRSRGSLLRGDYETCLKNWLSFYPKDQLLILLNDDIATRPLWVLQTAGAHLGVDTEVFRRYDSRTLGARVFEGTGHPMRESLRPILHEIYDAKVESLEKFLGIDLSAWRKP